MSRDLSFWKCDSQILLEHNKIYKMASNGEFVDGLEELPIESIRQSLERYALFNWKKLSSTHYERGKEAIEVFTTSQFVRIDCYNVSETHMNDFIDVMLEYGCPLYDALIDTRFD